MEINKTLEVRGHKYGVSFAFQAQVVQNIKQAMSDSPNWSRLSADKREALEMIATKISRILCGDPEYHDSWHDIVGYSKLVADEIQNSTKG